MKRILFYLVPVLFCFGIGAMAGLAVGSDDTTGAFGQIRVHYAF